MRNTRGAWRIVAAMAMMAVAIGVLPVSEADATPRVTITSSLGQARVSATGSTTVSITGSGFQSIQNGFGGIYMLFGWVRNPSSGSWRPSRGGVTGTDMLYVPDSESKDNKGYERFISFPGSSTEEAANGGEVSAKGTISLTMVIPGPTFTAQDREGNATSVDCRKVQCGIITIGAHGVVNANNESFTPVTFVGATSASSTAQTTGSSSKATVASSANATSSAATAQPSGDSASIGLDQKIYQAGRVVTYTGQGFAPGEQVAVSLSAGLAAAGPLTAGRFGEVAGTIPLPSDIRAGTQVIRLVGAGSGRSAEATISVMADPNSFETPQAEVSGWWTWAAIAAAVAAGLLTILLVSSLITTLIRRRKHRGGKVRRRKVRGASAAQPTGDSDSVRTADAATGASPDSTAGSSAEGADDQPTQVLPSHRDGES